jgi:hypothetical protein
MTEEELRLLALGNVQTGSDGQPMLGPDGQPLRQTSTGGMDLTGYTPSSGLSDRKDLMYGMIPDQFKQDIGNFTGSQFRTPEKQQFNAANAAFRADSFGPTVRGKGAQGGNSRRLDNPYNNMLMQVKEMRRDEKSAEHDARRAAKGKTKTPRVRT